MLFYESTFFFNLLFLTAKCDIGLQKSVIVSFIVSWKIELKAGKYFLRFFYLKIFALMVTKARLVTFN